MPKRCTWCGDDPPYVKYHDEEWGVPVHDDLIWFEFIVLDAFQAGLSWKTVLHKREAFRQVFYGFDPVKVAIMSDKEREKARQNPAIIRNRLKIRATVKKTQFIRSIPQANNAGHLVIFDSNDTHGYTIKIEQEQNMNTFFKFNQNKSTFF